MGSTEFVSFNAPLTRGSHECGVLCSIHHGFHEFRVFYAPCIMVFSDVGFYPSCPAVPLFSTFFGEGVPSISTTNKCRFFFSPGHWASELCSAYQGNLFCQKETQASPTIGNRRGGSGASKQDQSEFGVPLLCGHFGFLRIMGPSFQGGCLGGLP